MPELPNMKYECLIHGEGSASFSLPGSSEGSEWVITGIPSLLGKVSHLGNGYHSM